MTYLAALVALPFIGGLLALLVGSKSNLLTRAIASIAIASNIVFTFLAYQTDAITPWIPSIGASIHFRLDGLSFVLVLLANSLTLFSLAFLSESQKRREGLFLFLLLTTLSGIIGIFITFDLLLFFLFWEVMLVPLYFMLLLFGEEQRQKAATRFLILTQASGLALLVSIIAVYAFGGRTFDYFELLRRPALSGELIFSLGFLLAFLVKLPALPFHIWMPSVFTNTPVSALMTGILIKTGAYGLMRFYVPLFKDATLEIAPCMMVLGLVGLIYGSLAAYSQRDIKKILAFSTIAHVGLILAGIFSQRPNAMTGVTILLITQAIGTGALLLICNHVYNTTRTREIGRFSGLFHSMPRAGVIALVLVMASVGLPGLGNFVGEWYVLLGIFEQDWHIAVVATLGVVLSSIYMLRFMHGIFFGPKQGFGPQTGVNQSSDLSFASTLLFSVLLAVLVFIGFYPSLLIDIVAPSWIY